MNTSSKTFLIILFCLLHNFSCFSQEIKSSFKGGEWFEFRIYYGIFNASYASLELSKDTIKKIPVFHAKGYGKTTGLASDRHLGQAERKYLRFPPDPDRMIRRAYFLCSAEHLH